MLVSIEFEARLAALIEEQGGREMRQKIIAELAISPSTLSQYLRGSARPSFERLVALASVLEVSLDDLVFGRPLPTVQPPELAPWEQAIDKRLLRVERATERYAALVRRVGHTLGEMIGDAVRSATQIGAVPGLILDEETLVLERFSRHTRTLGMRTDYLLDVSEEEGGVSTPGRFLATLAGNLTAGRRYSFVFVRRTGVDWARIAGQLRETLRTACGLSRSVLARCQLQETALPTGSGVLLYELDVAELRRTEPFLYDLVSERISADGWVGAVQPPVSGFGADILMDSDHLDHARRIFADVTRSRRTRGL